MKIGDLDCVEIEGDPEQGTIVLFHGYGANNQDLASLSRAFPGPRWIFPNGPIEIQLAPGYVGRTWFHVDIEAIQQAASAKKFEDIASALSPELEGASKKIHDFIEALDVPHNKLVLGGFSQGAILSLDAALNFKDQVKGLLLFSPTLVHEPQWKKLAPNHKGLPFFLSHGRQDNLLPFQLTERLEKLLQEGGLKGKLHPFTGGHEIPFSILLDLQPFLTNLFS